MESPESVTGNLAETIAPDTGGSRDVSTAVDALADLAVPQAETPAPEAAPAPTPGKRGRKPGRFSRTLSKKALVENGSQLERELEAAQQELDKLRGTPDAQKAQVQELEAAAGALAVTFGALSQVAARGIHPVWQLGEQESKQLGDVWAPIVAPYMSQGGPWVAPLSVTLAIFGPRLFAYLDARRAALSISQGTQQDDSAREQVRDVPATGMPDLQARKQGRAR